jgi:glycerophosphoryl diester phosphodiesterase
MGHQPLVIAHRGFSARFPENTLAAARAAIQVGADMVEVDVQQTADGKVAVFHDSLLRRLCGLESRISQVSLRRLQQSKPDVPTLEQMLNEVRGKARLLIEMKVVDGANVAHAIEHCAMIDEVIVFAFETERLVQLSRANPRIRRYGLVDSDLTASVRKLSEVIQVDGIGVASRLLRSAAAVRQLQRQVGKVFVWTVNRIGRMRQLGEWGVDGIITNHPDRARQVWPNDEAERS